MSKSSSIYVCSNCSFESTKWMGQCHDCGEWNTLEEVAREKELSTKLGGLSTKAVVSDLRKVQKKDIQRTSTGLPEFDRVLGGENGGGLVNGEVILLSGEPGVGKSTLLLQLLFNLAKSDHSVVYASAEESVEQINIRARRLFEKELDSVSIPVINSSDIDSIISALSEQKPKFVVLDSIQTVQTGDIRALPGGASQVKECASRITTFAKQNNITTIIVGHVTKEGIVAGPKLLEHLVDAVVSLEGESNSGFRLLRSGKNRFGSTNEVGVFEMKDNGLVDVEDISKMFVGTHKKDSIGVCLSSIVEGNRVLLLEVQALTNVTPFSLPKRVSEGVSTSKLQLLCAILTKHAGIDLSDKDVYVNISGGFKVKEPAVDLAICLAIASSAKNKPLAKKAVSFGEVSLTGDINNVSREEDRMKELKRLGYTSYCTPKNYAHIRDLIKSI